MAAGSAELKGLFTKAEGGDLRSLGRLLTLVENPYALPEDFVGFVMSRAGRAQVIGVTGIPGSGKSTLISRLIPEFRRRGYKVAVVAIDPSSPLTGGALLGDRLRMQERPDDPGVFIRSVSTRGLKGGLSLAALSMVEVFDALGYDKVLVETVGVGQAEVDVMSAAHTVVVVTMPGAGDDVQALKAGVMEIGDLYVLNKSDLPGADKSYEYLSFVLEKEEIGAHDEAWRPRLLKVSAVMGQGVEELASYIDEHIASLRQRGLAGHKVASRRLTLVRLMAERMLTSRIEDYINANGAEIEEALLRGANPLPISLDIARKACEG